MSDRYDVLVVGGGPSGAAAAYWLAQQGRRVLVVEKKRFPREKTCGDGLTPRAVRELHDMGLADPLADYQRYDGLRSIAHGVTLELAWPDHPDYPPYGYVIRRRDLNEMVAGQAVKAGATLWPAAEATDPLVEGGLVTGAIIHRKESGTREAVRARYLALADGRQAPDRRVGAPGDGTDVDRRRRRRRRDQPVQRRGHRLRVRDRAPGGRRARPRAHDRRRPRPAALSAAARRALRPLLQGGSRVREGDREPGRDARAHPGRHALPHAH